MDKGRKGEIATYLLHFVELCALLLAAHDDDVVEDEHEALGELPQDAVCGYGYAQQR